MKEEPAYNDISLVGGRSNEFSCSVRSHLGGRSGVKKRRDPRDLIAVHLLVYISFGYSLQITYTRRGLTGSRMQLPSTRRCYSCYLGHSGRLGSSGNIPMYSSPSKYVWETSSTAGAGVVELGVTYGNQEVDEKIVKLYDSNAKFYVNSACPAIYPATASLATSSLYISMEICSYENTHLTMVKMSYRARVSSIEDTVITNVHQSELKV